MRGEKILVTKINKNEILDIESGMSDTEKEELFQKVRKNMQADFSNLGKLTRWKDDSERDLKKSEKKSSWKIIIAACVSLALLIPTTVFAANRIGEYIVSLKQDKLHTVYHIDANNNIQSDSDSTNVKLVYDFSDSYETTIDGGSYYKFHYKDGFDAGKNFMVELLKIDTSTTDEFFTEDVKDSSNIDVNGRKAIYLKLYDTNNSQYNQATDYTQRIVLFFDDYGYAIQIYGMQGIGEEEFINLVGEINMTECSEAEAATAIKLSDYIERSTENNVNDTWDGLIEEGENEIYEIGQEFEYEGISCQIQSVDIRDTIDGLKKNKFSDCCGLVDLLSKYTDESGKLRSYTRELLSFGDGYDTPEKSVITTENISQKFVYVTMQLKNNTDSDQDVMACKKMAYVQEKQGDYYYNLSEYERGEISCFQLDQYPQYFEETAGGKGYYIRKLKAGETMIFHTGYFVDEDKLNEMMIQFDNGASNENGGMKYVDIRQDATK